MNSSAGQSAGNAAEGIPARPPSLWHQTRTALLSLYQDDRLIWIYVFKMACAALLALWLAMLLDLSSPRTAMTTVFIVMQPQSGMILSKSFYRMMGTLVGTVAVVLCVALFAQTPELFLLSTALWIGLCTAGSAYNRNFRSYGFVLSGYTVALIGIPAALAPATTFDSVVTRVTELSLGIACAAVVSTVIFPQRSSARLVLAIRGRFTAFAQLLGGTLNGSVERKQLEEANTRFIGEIIGLEAIRSFAYFEDAEVRMRSGRLTRMNNEFMALSTRVHALHQLMNRLHERSHVAIIEAIEGYFKEVGPLLTRNSGEPVMSAADAADAASKLGQYKSNLPKRMRVARNTLLGEIAADSNDMLDFDTASELLYRVIDQLHAYTLTYASLVPLQHEREEGSKAYRPKTSLLMAAIAGLRAAIVLIIVSSFWIISGWPNGAIATLNAATICAIVSAAPNPAIVTKKMSYGAVLAIVLGYFYTFHVYPQIDGFLLLAVALLPALMFAIYLTVIPTTAAMGMGLCICFPFLAIPDNLTRFNAYSYLNDSAAFIFSILIATIAFQVLMPPSTRWLIRHMEKQLRKQVVMACFGKIANLTSNFESSTRDLMHQIAALTATQPDLKKSALGWMFATLEIGHAIIELREEVTKIEKDCPNLLPNAVVDAIKNVRDALSELFSNPTQAALTATFESNQRAMTMLREVIGPHYRERNERHRLQRTLSYLHFIRTALLDPQSPLSALQTAHAHATTEGKKHAA